MWSSPCYNPRHEHAPGGGCYGVQGFRDMLREARQQAPGFPLSTESCQEWYLDLFDSHIICGVSLERLKWQADQFALELARTVTFGLQPLVSNLRAEHSGRHPTGAVEPCW